MTCHLSRDPVVQGGKLVGDTEKGGSHLRVKEQNENWKDENTHRRYYLKEYSSPLSLVGLNIAQGL